MGSYAALTIGKYDFLLSKNSLDPSLLCIYNTNDKKIDKYYDEEGEEHVRYSYQTTVGKAKQCLDVIGYTIVESKKCFERYKGEVEFEFEYNFEDNAQEKDNEFTFEAWSDAVLEVSKHLIDNGIDYDGLKKIIEQIDKDKEFHKYLVANSVSWDSELYFGMPYEMDAWNVIRIIMENLSDETKITLDYTDLVDGGWYDPEQEIETFYGQRIIVMTEGKTDSKVISKSMEILYPHLYHFFYFMDFDISKAQGSTNFLTHYIKAFIGAGISNKIIALFDNDSAARSEILNLRDIRIPHNIRVATLPNIELANEYPTIGPYGDHCVNINGLACSIELFLGENILRDENGQLTPVIWKGYIERIGKYQGEIINKDNIQQLFFSLVNEIETGKRLSNAHDWREMEVLLQMIFNIFK